MQAITDEELIDVAMRNPRTFLGVGIVLDDGSRGVIAGANAHGFEVVFYRGRVFTRDRVN